MEYRNLGRSGLKVSQVCLGAMTFGKPAEGAFMHNVSAAEETAHQMLNRALELGVNFVDTADVYGDDGLSERVIGRWFAQSSERRDQVVLATKMRFKLGDGPDKGGAGAQRVVACCDDSLRRLQTDHIDLYQIHMQDNDVPEEETLRALDSLVRQGKVRHIGISNYAAYRMMKSHWLSDAHSLAGHVSLQAQYSLTHRTIEREHVPACRELGMGILAWSPLTYGFLTGKYTRNNPPPADSRLGQGIWQRRFAELDTDRLWSIVDTLLDVAAGVEATPAQVALAWLQQRPHVSSVIIGARTLTQLEENIASADLTLPDDAVAKLDKVSKLDLGYPYDFMKAVMGSW